jgi:hypothetical protein
MLGDEVSMRTGMTTNMFKMEENVCCVRGLSWMEYQQGKEGREESERRGE